MKQLPKAFYKRKDVLEITRDLIGKIIRTDVDGKPVAVRIVEAEAYIAITDRASHSFGGKRTQRNEHMYGHAGTVYVYICYGMHQMLNVITNDVDIPDAVLIRAGEPIEGESVMAKRCGKKPGDFTLTKGPGNLAKALGIDKSHSGKYYGEHIHLLDDGFVYKHDLIATSGRIGVDGAGKEAASLPYRFYVKGNKYVSGSPRN